MLDGFNNLCLTIMDPLLNWTLSLPKDITLVILAVFSSAVLTALRLFTTKQDILKRCTADKKQLKKINRIAKSNKDKDARKRCKLTKNQILLKELLFEGKPLIASLLPIILLATWGLARLGYHPTKGDEKVTVNLYPAALSRLETGPSHTR
ncbi:MAG TPA: hypothetical protein ENL03_05105 [Phycisphaerae bacterium]|nr:hypothetical protein [Phycisphaerae bacterium]